MEPIPTTLEGFGYHFNRRGQLRHIETKQPYLFDVVPGNHSYNQARYEALGDVVADYVYELMEKDCGLSRVYVPITESDDDDTVEPEPSAFSDEDQDQAQDQKKKRNAIQPKSFFFQTPNAMTCDKLMILIHGAGAVRAGIWARRLIINDSLNSGSMIPFINRAKTEGYGVVVLNGNFNSVVDPETRKRYYIKGNSSPEDHCLYVWDHFISKAAASAITIVAHSYGGVVTTNLIASRKDAIKRVAGIAFTDSVHSLSSRYPIEAREVIEERCINWVASSNPRDTVEHSYKGDCSCLSSGARKHEETSWAAYESIFPYLAKCVANFLKK